MKQHPGLYLEVSVHDEEPHLPLHTSIALFLLSYCECKSFKVFLVFTNPDASSQSLKSQLPGSLDVCDIQREDVPQLVRGCRLPAVLDETERLCRAGLAVVLRHIINKTLAADSSRNDVLALLGFKKTCLKACAEVSGKHSFIHFLPLYPVRGRGGLEPIPASWGEAGYTLDKSPVHHRADM